MAHAMRIRELEPGDPEALARAFAGTVWAREPAHFGRYAREQGEGLRVTFVALCDREVAGHASLVWQSKHPPFREQAIPEVQDLNVAPRWRRRGAASALIDAAETRARRRCARIGIGFGLHAGYGAAQRLYTLRGYVPDGTGAWYGERPVAEQESVPVDDDLVLYLVKELSSAGPGGS